MLRYDILKSTVLYRSDSIAIQVGTFSRMFHIHFPQCLFSFFKMNLRGYMDFTIIIYLNSKILFTNVSNNNKTFSLLL